MNRHKITGMTLLEVMLVTAIATSLILAAISMYQSYKTDNDYLILRENVDLLFTAMKAYYQQQCDLSFSTNGSISSKGALTFNPNNLFPPRISPVVAFDVTTVNQYISFPWPRSIPEVDNSGAVNTTYLAQFNLNIGTRKNVSVCSPYTIPQCSTPTPLTGSSVVLWQSQIAVKMKDPTKTTRYLASAGADCAVNVIPPNAVDCSTGVSMGGSANYMVWQRMPSFFSPKIQSLQWISNPVTKEFKLQYTHDPMYELYNPGATPSDVYTYYYCGG